MFKSVTAGALAVLGCNAITPEQGEKLACSFVYQDFITFDLAPLMREDVHGGEEHSHPDYEHWSSEEGVGLEWDFCHYLAHSTCFARTTSVTEASQCLTDDSYVPASWAPIEDPAEDGHHLIGIQFT